MELMILAVPDLPPRLSRRLLLDLEDHALAFVQDVENGVDVDELDPPQHDLD